MVDPTCVDTTLVETALVDTTAKPPTRVRPPPGAEASAPTRDNSCGKAPAAVRWPQRWLQLAGQIERVDSVAGQQRLLTRLSQAERPLMLAFVNAHALNSVVSSSVFFQALSAADVLLRDGSGMATLFKWLAQAPGLNLNGTDFIPLLIERFNGRPVALLGTRDPYLRQGVDTVVKQLAPDSLVISADGFRPLSDYVTLLQAQRPALVVLGMGMPRQELVAAALRDQLDFACVIVCGGAIIDFLGGKTPRAPAWLRRLGLEWLYRLAQEPRRLFGRYVLGNPLFLARALRLRADRARKQLR
jgi:exopolysaccharide biosynthesis WecB/TagA/CpsF family protein